MTTDIKDLARALAWIVERLGHDESCSAVRRPNPSDDYPDFGICSCNHGKILSLLQHGADQGEG